MTRLNYKRKLLNIFLSGAVLLSYFPVGHVAAQGSRDQPAMENMATAPAPITETGAGFASSIAPWSSEPAVPAPLGPALSLMILTPDTETAAGQQVTVEVRVANDGDEAIHDVVISGALPASVELAGTVESFDPANQQLSWSLEELAASQVVTLSLPLLIGQEAGWDGGVALALEAHAVQLAEPVQASSILRVAYPLADGAAEMTLVSSQGGQLISPDGRVTVTFPRIEQVMDSGDGSELLVSYSPMAKDAGANMQVLRQFAVTLRNDAGEKVQDYGAPVQIRYHFTQVEEAGLNPEELSLAVWDKEQEAWQYLSTQVDHEQQLLTAQTTRMSVMAGGYIKLPSDDYMPALQQFQEIDLYTGGSSASYPIQVPAGRGGLAPQLSLSYSSGSIDGGQPWDADVQADSTGYGWSLGGIGYVGRQNVGGWNWHQNDVGQCEQWYQYSAGDVFSLVLSGAGGDLVRGTDTLPDGTLLFHTADENYAQIWTIPRYGQWHDYGPDEWHVKTKDGTHYVFSNRLGQVICNEPGCDPRVEGNKQVYKWLLNQVQDVHGNTISYEYTKVSAGACAGGFEGHYTYYPLRITYNGGLAKVEFQMEARSDLYARSMTNRCPNKFQQNQRLKAIKTFVKVGGQWQLVRQYNLAHDYTTYDDNLNDGKTKAKLTLKSIQECGTDGTGCLPATSFTYYPLGTPSNPQVGRNRLKSVANGYGGKQTFVYEMESGYRVRVQSRTIEDGLGQSGTWSYTYSGSGYNSPKISGTSCQGLSSDAGTLKPRSQPNTEFRGHSQVAVTAPDGNVQVHRFAQDDVKKGKETEVLYQDATAQHNWYRYVLNDYAYIQVPANPDQGGYTFALPEIAFVYQSQGRDRAYDGTASYKEKKTTYEYDASMQGGMQYGNLTTVRDYDENGTQYRTSRKWYCPNANLWIVDKMNAEGAWAGEWGAMLYGTWNYYDQETNHLTCPSTKGELKRSQRLNYYGEDGDWYYWDTAEAAYSYDSYGNVTTETSYAGYGRVKQNKADPNNIVQTITPAQARTTAINYNFSGLGYYLYPEKVTYPLSSLYESATYDYRLGKINSYSDMNGNVTSYYYDVLGRVVRVAKPGDTYDLPTTFVDYNSFGVPGQQRVVVYRREISGQGGPLDGTVWQERFFDGLGRTIQVHQEDEGQEVRTSTAFDIQGRKTAEWVAYFGTHGEDGGYGAYGYVPPDPNGARTRYTYDPLGRVYDLTNPDGTVIHSRYNPWKVATIDEKEHMKIQETDAFGRLLRVKEYTGSFAGGPNWSATPYATTVYAYDERDLLTDVTDAASNVTTMVYNMLGFKTAMSDRDMGSWLYAYDALGNLTRQTDAKGQRVCMYYDAMSRLTGKHYRTNDSCPTSPTLATSYSYDAGTNGKGQRTGMTDASGSASWAYDNRGRKIRENKIVSSVGTFVTQWGYGAQDQVLWMRYPENNNGGTNGEVVNYSYTARLLLNSVIGTGTYVQSTTYDAPGRVGLRVMGNNVLTTTYQYYSWTTPNGQGRLRQIDSEKVSNHAGLQNLNYTYDAAGNVSTIVDSLAGPQTQSFSYDELDRLISAQATGGSYGIYGPESYVYNTIGNLTSKAGVSYGYNDGAHKHAVTHLNGVQKYWYDADGNQTKRVVGSDTYDPLTYDYENRLTQVTKNGVTYATFAYDGDGIRVKGTVNGVTTSYVGNYFEWTGGTSTMKKYYYAGTTRVAMRTGSSTLNFLLADQLGSQAITTDASGVKTAELRYKAWGEDRPSGNPGTTPTTFRYTGQRLETDIGLYYYGARWYDSALGRFIQADTIVPPETERTAVTPLQVGAFEPQHVAQVTVENAENAAYGFWHQRSPETRLQTQHPTGPSNPQELNRFSYVHNNPLKYTDPTGHAADAGEGGEQVIVDPPEPPATGPVIPEIEPPAIEQEPQTEPLITSTSTTSSSTTASLEEMPPDVPTPEEIEREMYQEAIRRTLYESRMGAAYYGMQAGLQWQYQIRSDPKTYCPSAPLFNTGGASFWTRPIDFRPEMR
jgi:RHS repeat-associated protein